MIQRMKAAFADLLIRRSLRGHFRGVYLLEQELPDPQQPAIVFLNHHSWWDGYLLHPLALHWRPGRGLVWMRELSAFPPFGALGAMPLPDDDPGARVATVRRTIRLLDEGPWMLFIFPEGDMHPGPGLAPFANGLYRLHRRLPHVPLFPAAIRIDQGIHQCAEAQVMSGPQFRCDESDEEAWLQAARETVTTLLADCAEKWRNDPLQFRCLLPGRLSVDERRCSGGTHRGPKPWEHTGAHQPPGRR